MTSSTLDWAMVDGGGAGFPTLAGGEVGVGVGEAEADPTSLAEAASEVAQRVRGMLSSRGDRLHGVAVSWNDDASVGAALLLEWLADDGFDHVVPVRYRQAAQSRQGLARGAALTLVPRTELAGSPISAGVSRERFGGRRGRSRSYTGAMLMLALGALTFVASVAAALSLQLGAGPEVPRVAPEHATVARVAVPAAPTAPVPAPSATPAPEEPAPAPAAEFSEETPPRAEVELGSLWDAPVIDAELPPALPASSSDRIRAYIVGPATAE